MFCSLNSETIFTASWGFLKDWKANWIINVNPFSNTYLSTSSFQFMDTHLLHLTPSLQPGNLEPIHSREPLSYDRGEDGHDHLLLSQPPHLLKRHERSYWKYYIWKPKSSVWQQKDTPQKMPYGATVTIISTVNTTFTTYKSTGRRLSFLTARLHNFIWEDNPVSTVSAVLW